MSNLTDLLPAGGGGKNINFVASGTLPSGQTVALKTNGQVEAVGLTAESIGSPQTFQASARSDWPGCAYDSNTNKIVIFYFKQASNQVWGVVGTVSGSSISFGTPILVVNSIAVYDVMGCLYDPVSQNVVYGWRQGTSSGLQVIIATVSGTSLTLGSPTAIDTGNNEDGASMVYDTNANKILFIYPDATNSQYGTGRVGTVSGRTISFGSKTVFNSAASNHSAMAYDSVAQKIVMMYNNGGPGMAQVATISGTGVSFGTAIEFGAASGGLGTKSSGCAYDVSSGKTVLGYAQTSGGNGVARTASISGTSLTLGTKATFAATNIQTPLRLVYDANAKKVIAIYSDATNSYSLRANALSVSGSTITVGAQAILNSTTSNYPFAAYDSTANKTIIPFSNNNVDGEAVVYSPSFTNLSATTFIGITDAAISSGASGSVTIKGGIVSNSSLLPSVFSGSAGSEVVFEAARADHSMSIFDSSNNKVVIIYADNGDSDNGKAIVGTVSGSSISYGTPVTFNAATTTRLSGTFDSNSNKIVIVYNDGGDSNKTKSIVGTVSGTSISFGSEATVTNNITSGTTTTFDSNLNKVVTFYKDDSNNEYGTAAVGTVSGTSISFGTPVVFESAQSVVTQSGSCFDTSNNKTVTVYRDVGNSSHGTAIVGTVSGTSISFGTVTAFHAASTEETLCAFDSGNNKVVVAYRDNAAPKALASRVGTVSGTGISFGTEATVQTISAYITHPAMTYSPDAGRVVIVYSNGDNSTYGTYAIGAVSGTDITYETPVVFAAAATEDCGIAYDTNLDKFVISFKDVDNSNHGTSVVLTVAGAVPALATGSTYYVQDDGTLSTTSSSVTAGKALSATSINLEYNS